MNICTTSTLQIHALPGASAGVLAHLLEKENLKKAIKRYRCKNCPPNPTSLDDLGDIPDTSQKTITGDKFLIFDSFNQEDLNGRVLVFATRKNLEILAASPVWYMDGSFKVTYL